MKTSNSLKRGRLATFFVGVAGFILVLLIWNARDFGESVQEEFDVAAVELSARPRVETLRGFSKPAEVERAISEREDRAQAAVAKRGAAIRDGQRKTIHWINPIQKVKTPTSLIYIHGFSGSPLELEPTVTELAKRLGANLFSTRLTAHGLSDGEDFANVRARDWAVDVAEAIEVGRQIGDRVVVLAVSTGAPIAVWHLRNFSTDQIAAVVLLSPNYGITATGAFALRSRWANSIARVVLGTHRSFTVMNDLHGARWTSRYRSEGVAAMMKAVAVTADDAREFNSLPVLTFYTQKDDVVLVSRIEEHSKIFTHPVSKVIDWKLGQKHQLASAAFFPELVPALVDELANWIDIVVRKEAGAPKAEPTANAKQENREGS